MDEPKCGLCKVSLLDHQAWIEHVESESHLDNLRQFIPVAGLSFVSMQELRKRVREAKDKFFNQSNCERCGSEEAKLTFILSWFNEQKICITCSEKEGEIRREIREYFKNPQADLNFEGCGFIPSLH